MAHQGGPDKLCKEKQQKKTVDVTNRINPEATRKRRRSERNTPTAAAQLNTPILTSKSPTTAASPCLGGTGHLALGSRALAPRVCCGASPLLHRLGLRWSRQRRPLLYIDVGSMAAGWGLVHAGTTRPTLADAPRPTSHSRTNHGQLPLPFITDFRVSFLPFSQTNQSNSPQTHKNYRN